MAAILQPGSGRDIMEDKVGKSCTFGDIIQLQGQAYVATSRHSTYECQWIPLLFNPIWVWLSITYNVKGTNGNNPHSNPSSLST